MSTTSYHDFSRKKLLQRSWAGELTLEEAQYIKRTLEANPKLRRKWGIRGKGRIPLTLIAAKAFPEDPEWARHHIRAEQARAHPRIDSDAEMKHSKPRSEKVKALA